MKRSEYDILCLFQNALEDLVDNMNKQTTNDAQSRLHYDAKLIWIQMRDYLNHENENNEFVEGFTQRLRNYEED